MDTLQYRTRCFIDELAVGECTMHPATGSDAAKWWLLWFYAPRDTDGVPEIFGVPVNPNGPYLEQGPGGRTWGLTKTDQGWQISPSINVLDNRDAVAGTHDHPSVWHHTPCIVNVPDGEAWTNGVVP